MSILRVRVFVNICLRISFLVSDAAFLRITPNRLQHFEMDTISFNCEGSDSSTRLRATRNIKGFDSECDVKKTPTGSSCTVDRAYPGDSGEYWCETEGRDRSNSVNITITAGPVILEIPAFPILEGDDVTFHCRSKKNFSNLRADFYKDDVLMQNSPTEEMTINNVSRSDEGLYKCSISDVGESPRSWLAVRANTISIISPSLHEEPRSNQASNSSDSPRVHILLWVAVTILMLVLVLLVVGFLYIRKCRELEVKRDVEKDQLRDLLFFSDDPTRHSSGKNQLYLKL
ncbi:hypothetical protein L3Q82_016496 [Scortum barcoo]|uniref:Uncharacterized protein n=1 Tax=Scortum barcoo TaxID=214431 RepID=A0ACB8X8V0_9TELE|nr:hypothetical protein L3Q82_016496 [Scortum barcoo]